MVHDDGGDVQGQEELVGDDATTDDVAQEEQEQPP